MAAAAQSIHGAGEGSERYTFKLPHDGEFEKGQLWIDGKEGVGRLVCRLVKRADPSKTVKVPISFMPQGLDLSEGDYKITGLKSVIKELKRSNKPFLFATLIGGGAEGGQVKIQIFQEGYGECPRVQKDG